MPIRLPRYSKEEASRRGKEIYDRDVRSHVEANNKGKYVAIAIDTGFGKWMRTKSLWVIAWLLVSPTRKPG